MKVPDDRQLQGFFEGWPNPPSPEIHLEILNRSYAVILAVDDTVGRVIGFVTAIADGFFCAHVTLLEVLPDYRRGGVGTELVRRMLAQLKGFYGISLSCDDELRHFYARFGMQPGVAMNIRNHRWQAETPA